MDGHSRLQTLYPWIQQPLIVSAPMRLISGAAMAVEVSRGGGIGFIAAGSDTSTLEPKLQQAVDHLTRSPLPPSTTAAAPSSSTPPANDATATDTLPIGVGFINWGADLDESVALLARYQVAAAWFFAPRETKDLAKWTAATRDASRGRTSVWVQVCTVAEAVEVTQICRPDVLVVQGTDAGGHGRRTGAGIMALFPEVDDAIAALEIPQLEKPILLCAGGIADGRGVAAALVLGAQGVVMGTRFLACHEAEIARGYRDEVIRASDGGATTTRTSLYDQLRGTTDWPPGFNARGVLNRSWTDAEDGMALDENRRLYQEAAGCGDEGWGPQGRMTTYAGTAVGLVRQVLPARQVVEEVRKGAREVLARHHGG